MNGNQAETGTAQPDGRPQVHRVHVALEKSLQGEIIETGDDFIDSKQLRAPFHGPMSPNTSTSTPTSLPASGDNDDRRDGRDSESLAEEASAVIQTVDYLREILAMAKMSEDSTYFISLLGWFTSTEYIHIAMEYAPYGDLASCVSAPVPPLDTQSISSQIVSALAIMHSKHFSHRDLTPANVFVIQQGPNWWVKLGDFGMSKRVHNDHTAFHTSINSAYSAPEMLGLVSDDDGGTYTNAVDMWSLGCLMHWLLTHQGPFGTTVRSSQRQFYAYVLGKDTLSVDALNAQGVSAEVQSLIQQLLAPNPKDRITSAEAVTHHYFRDEGYHQGTEAAGSISDASSIRSVGRTPAASSSFEREINNARHVNDLSVHRQAEPHAMPQFDQDVPPRAIVDDQVSDIQPEGTASRDFAPTETSVVHPSLSDPSEYTVRQIQPERTQQNDGSSQSVPLQSFPNQATRQAVEKDIKDSVQNFFGMTETMAHDLPDVTQEQAAFDATTTDKQQQHQSEPLSKRQLQRLRDEEEMAAAAEARERDAQARDGTLSRRQLQRLRDQEEMREAAQARERKAQAREHKAQARDRKAQARIDTLRERHLQHLRDQEEMKLATEARKRDAQAARERNDAAGERDATLSKSQMQRLKDEEEIRLAVEAREHDRIERESRPQLESTSEPEHTEDDALLPPDLWADDQEQVSYQTQPGPPVSERQEQRLMEPEEKIWIDVEAREREARAPQHGFYGGQRLAERETRPSEVVEMHRSQPPVTAGVRPYHPLLQLQDRTPPSNDAAGKKSLRSRMKFWQR